MAIADDLLAACPSLLTHEPLSRHTSWGIGGPADFYAPVNTRAELLALHRLVRDHHLPVFFIGAGSNLLVSDLGIRGLVIHLQGDFRKYEFQGSRLITGAAVWMPTLAKQSAERGLSGLESLIGVPGTIGGGLVMNAGTRDGVLGDSVESVETIDEASQLRQLPKSEIDFSYRHSSLQNRWMTGAVLSLKPQEVSSIIQRIDGYMQYRTRTQPLATSNCGSVFKNPLEGPAAQWIDKAHLKGAAVGGARISERHANFIINEKKATAADVRELMRQIQSRVKDLFNVSLEPEVKMVGEWPEP